jgi:hypothetical protein
MGTEITINQDSTLFDTEGMFYKEFGSDYRQIRYYTLIVLQKAPPEIKELNLLEQQLSEIIKNAVKHGNKKDPAKTVKIWYKFTTRDARIIVEDEGEGFQNIEEWNEFNRKRLEYFRENDFEKLADYVSYRTVQSDETDGGNALFAAVEYWNGGFVYNEKRNKVAAYKTFPKRHHRINGREA